jgi:hypothetical protein
VYTARRSNNTGIEKCHLLALFAVYTVPGTGIAFVLQAKVRLNQNTDGM